MKLSDLLHQREALLRQAHLANLAFAHERLGDFAARIARGRLRGPVSLKRADDDVGRPWPTLTALRGHQSVIEEHFSDEDIIDLVDVIAYALEVGEDEVVFDLAEVEVRFLQPVRLAMQEAGVQFDEPSAPPGAGEAHGDVRSPACDQDER
jgi:hypothetical protein